MRIAVVFFALLGLASARFGEDFNHWISEKFGDGAQRKLERRDIAGGSFGGKSLDDSTMGEHQPVIFVHGVSSRAGEMMKKAASYFKENGYKDSELYATTYNNGGKGDKMSWMKYRMECSAVKQVRAMIVATHKYTGKKVDVVAFSLGVPIARKAILGGRCVDTRQRLGGSLTHIVDTFVGVAGPNHGVAPMMMPMGGMAIPGCALMPFMPICNPKDGLFSGFCPMQSEFLTDINRRHKYEATHVYSIGSNSDEIVGHRVCGQPTTRIPHQDGEKRYGKLKHNQVFHKSYNTMLRMVRDHQIV